MNPGTGAAVRRLRARFRLPHSLHPHRLPLLEFVFVFVLPSCRSDPGQVTVYAASSLTEVLQEAAEAFSDSTGTPIALRFGASGTLSTLIGEGAPADLFLSADTVWIDRLRARKLLVDGSPRIVAGNDLVAIVPKEETEAVPTEPRALLVLPRVAVGEPQTVPAGRYAAQALANLGAWDGLQGRLVYAPNARAVLALVGRGEADAGIVYASDARADDRVKVAFAFPRDAHDPIVYVAAIVTGAPHPRSAEEFLEYLFLPRARSIFAAHGFGEF